MSDPSGFNFDDWLELARNDPRAFEQQRLAYIHREIDKAPEETRRRMHGLQWQVDCIRAQAKTPLAACLRISGLMWDTVLGDNGLLDTLRQLSELQTPGDLDRAASVIPFPDRGERG